MAEGIRVPLSMHAAYFTGIVEFQNNMMLWLFLMRNEFPVPLVNMLVKMIVTPKVKMKSS